MHIISAEISADLATSDLRPALSYRWLELPFLAAKRRFTP